MSIRWIEVNGKRVAPVRAADGSCGTRWRDDITRVECPFYKEFCGAVDATSRPCTEYGTATFFITEDQLPEYLAAKLLGEAG